MEIDELDLINDIKKYPELTEKEKEAQRISVAYGNGVLEDEGITLEGITEAASVYKKQTTVVTKTA